MWAAIIFLAVVICIRLWADCTYWKYTKNLESRVWFWLERIRCGLAREDPPKRVTRKTDGPKEGKTGC